MERKVIMRERIRAVTLRTARLCLMTLVLLGIVALTQLSRSAAATAPEMIVRMLDMPLAFQPNVIKIKVGDSVE
jgi:plastocyanin